LEGREDIQAIQRVVGGGGRRRVAHTLVRALHVSSGGRHRVVGRGSRVRVEAHRACVRLREGRGRVSERALLVIVVVIASSHGRVGVELATTVVVRGGVGGSRVG
jgi:hypothetical protein